MPEGWIKAGKSPGDYDMRLDDKVHRGGQFSGMIKSKVSPPSGFGTLMQVCGAAGFYGERVRMTGYIKVKDVQNWVGMWMRVDAPGKGFLSFDNMQDRPLKGTIDWKAYEIVLDVPLSSTNLVFGILLDGPGQAWIDDIKFEVVGSEVPNTDVRRFKYPRQPVGLDFEKQ